jgi:hypothetical protein
MITVTLVEVERFSIVLSSIFFKTSTYALSILEEKRALTITLKLIQHDMHARV